MLKFIEIYNEWRSTKTVSILIHVSGIIFSTAPDSRVTHANTHSPVPALVRGLLSPYSFCLPCGHLAAHMVLDQRRNLPVVMVATLPMEPLSALLALNLTESDIGFEVVCFQVAPQSVVPHPHPPPITPLPSAPCSLAGANRRTCAVRRTA